MRPKIQAVCDRFDKLEAELRRCETGTSKFKEIYSRSIAEYKDQCAKGKVDIKRTTAKHSLLGFFDRKKDYIEVFLRLRHIKQKLKDWRERERQPEPESSY